MLKKGDLTCQELTSHHVMVSCYHNEAYASHRTVESETHTSEYVSQCCHTWESLIRPKWECEHRM